MSRKQEIKVYLPVFQVGQMEHMKNKGTRSAFISNAIKDKLNKIKTASPFDYSALMLLCTARDKLQHESFFGSNDFEIRMLQLLIEKVESK